MARFVLGFCVMVGALMFLGCPLRMVIRLGGGDGNALLGLVGFVLGIFVGTLFLKERLLPEKVPAPVQGGGLPHARRRGGAAGPAGGRPRLYLSSLRRAPAPCARLSLLALVAGLVVGALAQRTRLCMVGGIRDAMLFRDFHLLMGFVAIFVAVLVGNLIVGALAPAASTPALPASPWPTPTALWNLLGMVLVGLASVLLGGCPLRQLILAGSGNSDSAVAVLGMVVGAAFCHNFGLASSAEGPTAAGKIAVIIGLVVVAAIGGAQPEPRKNKEEDDYE